MLKNTAKTKGVALIVYPEESGTMFAPAFKAHHISCLCIVPDCNQQQQVTPAINTQNYIAIFYDPIDNQSLIATLQAYPILYVLPGSERGVPRADELSKLLGLFTNDHRQATARYDKSRMAKTAQSAGLAIPQQTTVTSEQQLNTLMSNDINWPVVLKPNCSMGSEDVTLCPDSKSLTMAFRKILNTQNRLGRENQQCIVQEYLTGTEFAIDTVSFNGMHKVTAVWQYIKSDPDILGLVPFTSKRLMSANGPRQAMLLDYTYQLLDALGIRYGPAHTELVINDNDAQPSVQSNVQLMEVGARLHGGSPAMLVGKACTGQSQAEHCVSAYLNPELFLNQQTPLYQLTQYGEIVLLLTPDEGLYANTGTIELIRSMDAVSSINININTNAKTTQSLARIAGLVILMHTDQEVIIATLNTIRALEKTALYDGSDEL